MTHSTEKRNLEFVGIDIAKGKFDICLGSDNKNIPCLIQSKDSGS